MSITASEANPFRNQVLQAQPWEVVMLENGQTLVQREVTVRENYGEKPWVKLFAETLVKTLNEKHEKENLARKKATCGRQAEEDVCQCSEETMVLGSLCCDCGKPKHPADLG
jgi:hypothetical protein